MATTLPPFASTSKLATPLSFPPPAPRDDLEYDIELVAYEGEHQLGAIIALIEKELSEPYLIYTYRYFLNEWPHLAWLARSIPRRPRPPPLPPRDPSKTSLETQVESLSVSSGTSVEEQRQYVDQHTDELRSAPVGVIVNKMDRHLKGDRLMRGYIAMLSVHPAWRKRGIARQLAQAAVDRMAKTGAEEIVLETEVDNGGALALYESLGFMREKRLFRFYLNAKDSFRLVLPITKEHPDEAEGVLDDRDSEPSQPAAPPRPARPTDTMTSHEALYDFDGLIM